MQILGLGVPLHQRPVAAAAPPPLDSVVLGSVTAMERDLGAELAQRAREAWVGKPASEMTPVWLSEGWLTGLGKDQVASQDHSAYVLPILRTTTHPAAPAILEVVDEFLPTLTSARERNHLVEGAARALRKPNENEARLALGMYVGALQDGGLAVRRHLARQVCERDGQFADVMKFGLDVAARLDDGTPLGQHQASRALYSSFFATMVTGMPREELKVMAAALQSHPGNTLWRDDRFATRYPDTVALITSEEPQVNVARANLQALGDPLFARSADPVGTLQQIGQLWPERQKLVATQFAGVRQEGDHLRVGGVSLRVKA